MELLLPIFAVALLVQEQHQAEVDAKLHYPSSASTWKGYCDAEQYRQHVEAQIQNFRFQGYVHRCQLENGHFEAIQLRDLWYKLHQLSNSMHPASRSEVEQEVREMIGQEAFMRGEWPGPLPLHHFDEQPLDPFGMEAKSSKKTKKPSDQ